MNVSISIKDQNGDDVFSRELDALADLKFNRKFDDRNANLCVKQHRSNAIWSLFNLARVALFNSLDGFWTLDLAHFIEVRRSYVANFSFLSFCGVCLYFVFKAAVVAIRLALFLAFNSFEYFKKGMN